MAAAKKVTSLSPTKIIDVAKPGVTAPSPSSRPLIITNHAVVQDPMVTSDAQADESSTETVPSATVSHSGHTVLQPLASSPLLAAAPETAVAPEKPKTAADLRKAMGGQSAISDVKPVADVKLVAKPLAVSVEPQPSLPSKQIDDVVPKPVPVTPEAQSIEKPAATIKGPQTEKEQDIAESEAEKRRAEIQEIIDSKQYYLSINSLEKRRTKQFVLSGVLLSIVLAAAWFDIALDAGIIKLGHVHALTHFFSH